MCRDQSSGSSVALQEGSRIMRSYGRAKGTVATEEE